MKKQKQAGVLFLVLTICCFLAGASKYYNIYSQKQIQQYYHASDNALNTGNVHIYFYDTNAQLQKGAVFRIAREASKEELRNDSILKEKIMYQERGYTIIYEAFISNRDHEGSKDIDIELEANRTGALILSGIPEGTYFLIEIKPPDGYHKTESVHCFAVEYSLSDKEKVIHSNSFETNRISVTHEKHNLMERHYTDPQFFAVVLFSITGAVLAWISVCTKKAAYWNM